MSESKDLIAVKVLTPEIVFAPGGVADILGKIESEVRSFKGDISTLGGRNAIASMAYKVARSKTALDDMGKQLVADWKSKASAVDAERRTIRDRLDALKDEVRQPLTDWENADKLRIEEHEKAILDIEALRDFGGLEPTAAQIKERADILAARPTRHWEEFAQRARETQTSVGNQLAQLYDRAYAREAEAAELARLRAESAAREQKEREERIATAAAEQARIAAETKAKREADELAAKADAERRRIAAEAAEAVAKAERAAKESERQRLQAVENERNRVALERAAEVAETAKREANKRHKARINNEILAALVQAGLSESAGKTVIGLIASGNCPHTKIQY
jgi:hypothetical protein